MKIMIDANMLNRYTTRYWKYEYRIAGEDLYNFIADSNLSLSGKATKVSYKGDVMYGDKVIGQFDGRFKGVFSITIDQPVKASYIVRLSRLPYLESFSEELQDNDCIGDGMIFHYVSN